MDLSDFGIHPDFGLQMHKYVHLQAFWSGFKIDNFPKSAIVCSVHFDLITQEMLHLQYRGGFHAGPGPH